MIKNGNDWLLERRPQRGIWGGLLAPVTLAEAHFEDSAASQTRIRNALAGLGLQLTAWANLGEVLSHTFTHFQLHIQPWICQVEIAGECPLSPLSAEAVETAALPTPVKKLLGSAGIPNHTPVN